MHPDRNLRSTAAGLLALVALAACGGGSSGPNTNTSITQAQADAMAGTAEVQVAAVTSGLASFSGGFGGLTGGFFAPSTPSGRALAVATRMAPPAFRSILSRTPPASGCDPVVTGDSTDTDGDGIVNNATYTFSAANCSYDDGQGNSIAINGSITLQDTDNQTVLFGYTIGFGQWGVTSVSTTQQGTQTFVFTVDGDQSGSVTAGDASAAEDITYTLSLDGSRVASFTSTTGLTYTPSSGTIDPGSQSRLQSGTFALTGSFSFNGSSQTTADGNWSFSLGTTSSLAYDETCFAESPFTGGQITGNITANRSAGFTIDYGPSCGETTITAHSTGLT